MITVIADDFTGAAEMAGIGISYGLRTELVTNVIEGIPPCDLLVYATDTRSMSEEEAVAVNHSIARSLWSAGCRNFFKKTDSALRGHILPEIDALLSVTDYRTTVLLPENPSKGRTVENGIYLIEDQPIDRTAFANDPEFPAYTSVIAERLPNVRLFGPNLPIEPGRVNFACAASREHVKSIVEEIHTHGDLLFAGAADFFTALLESKGYRKRVLPLFGGFGLSDTLIVCGSTVSRPLNDYGFIRRKNLETDSLPLPVFLGEESPVEWINELSDKYGRQRSLLVAVGHPSHGGKEFAIRLRHTIAELCEKLLERVIPEELVIEGGATAFAILDRLGWNRFRVTDEIAPGVVRMVREAAKPVAVTVKPGSYPWGDQIFR